MPVRTRYFPLGGGLDVATPAISVPPGRLLSCSNFEPDVEGGYRWAPGYERFDGGDQPHDQGFWGVEVEPFIPDSFPYVYAGETFNDAEQWMEAQVPLLASPDYLEDEYGEKAVQSRLVRLRDSGQSEQGIARVCGFTALDGSEVETIEPGVRYHLGLFRISGTLEIGQTVADRFTVVSRPTWRYAPTQVAEQEWLRVARSVYRSAVENPTGSGPIRGVWCLGDKVYAWRDDNRGATTVAYEAVVLDGPSQYRLQTAQYVDGTGTDTAGGMRILDREANSGLDTPDEYRSAQLLVFAPDGLYPADTNETVAMGDAFGNMRAGDVVRLRENGNQLEFTILSRPVLVGGEWCVEVRLQYALGSLTGADKTWIVEVETGAFERPGWSPVPDSRFCKALKFKDGAQAAGVPWLVGREVTTSGGFSGTIHRLIDWAGGYSTSDAVGYLLLRDVEGTVDDGDELLALPGPGAVAYMADDVKAAITTTTTLTTAAITAGTSSTDADITLPTFSVDNYVWVGVPEDADDIVDIDDDGDSLFSTFEADPVVVDDYKWWRTTAAGRSDSGAEWTVTLGITAPRQAALANGELIDFEIPAGERMRFDNSNFLATTGTTRAYATGGGKLFEIDENGIFGEVIIPTAFDLTGVGDDTNNHGKLLIPQEHENQLFVAAEGGRLINSVYGNPLNFSAVLSAAEFGLGHDIVGMESVTGGVLVIATTEAVKALYGKVGSFELRTVSEKSGLTLDSIRKVDDVYGLSWAGVAGLTRTDQFGDFNSDTISNAVAPLLRDLQPFFSCSSLVRSDNLYRLHYSGKRPHYEIGAFRNVTSSGGLNPDTDSGSSIANLSGPNSIIGSRGSLASLSLPLTPAVSWVESAAGGITLVFSRRYRDDTDDILQNHFKVTSDRIVLGFNATQYARLFGPDYTSDDFFRGMTVDVGAGTFTVDRRIAHEVVSNNKAQRTVTFSGSYRADNSFVDTSFTDGSNYTLTIRIPPEHRDGDGAKLVIRHRGRNTFYTIDRYERRGGDSLLAGAAHGLAYLTPVDPSRPYPGDQDNRTRELYEYEVAVQTENPAITETIAMYVPERGAAADRRGTATEERVQFGRTVYPVAIDAAWECGGPEGDRVFFSGSDGRVYQDRVGLNFDGEEIVGFVRTPFVHAGQPSHIKRWRRLDLELGSSRSLQFKVLMDLDFASFNQGSLLRNDEEVTGQGGYWDSGDVWDSFDWDGVEVALASTDLVGEGINASFLLSFRSDAAEGLVLQGMLLHYSTRRLRR